MYGTIIHSDQGFQYTSRAYYHAPQQLGAIGSHSRKGNCHDNACIESFFSHFKSEMFNLNSYQNEKELIQTIETYIYHYNYKRFQKDSTIELQLNIEFRWLHSLFYSCLLDGGKTRVHPPSVWTYSIKYDSVRNLLSSMFFFIYLHQNPKTPSFPMILQKE
ncbi:MULTISPECIES: IS3 family transposase [unclassified Bacillus (in: firmicutes)]|uniref:IS3 family transposase n=1 Tax=unclassified Bacillus (in: firmicutes) TaxID=185979 RepID=UPI0033652FD9